jgi:hypothetical protein
MPLVSIPWHRTNHFIHFVKILQSSKQQNSNSLESIEIESSCSNLHINRPCANFGRDVRDSKAPFPHIGRAVRKVSPMALAYAAAHSADNDFRGVLYLASLPWDGLGTVRWIVAGKLEINSEAIIMNQMMKLYSAGPPWAMFSVPQTRQIQEQSLPVCHVSQWANSRCKARMAHNVCMRVFFTSFVLRQDCAELAHEGYRRFQATCSMPYL